ncbi:MAG: PRC-barrel domain-containing protein [Streptosporangiaceae bacterium]
MASGLRKPEGKAAMAEATEFTIGARASCSDGHCGEVTRMIIDPATRAVTHLVIEPKHRRHRGRLVPLELVDTAAGQIRLRCTIGEFDQLEPAEEVDLEEGADYGGGYGAAESVQGYGGVGSMGVGGSASGMTIGGSLGHHRPVVLQDAVPLGETEVRPGEHVHALDGEIGQVQGFVVNPGDHQVTHVLLKEGHLWGRKEVAIPISAVTRVDEGIRLNITKQQVQDLPPAR